MLFLIIKFLIINNFCIVYFIVNENIDCLRYQYYKDTRRNIQIPHFLNEKYERIYARDTLYLYLSIR